jgi:hypothetical protein
MKTPADRVLARSGGTEGPVAGIFCRSTTQFQDPSSPNGSLAEMIDLLQELLSMLVVAQERYREGKPDIKPGDGKWYTTVPRWGGGSGGEIGNETGGSTDEVLLSKKESFSSSSAAAAEEDKRPAKDPMASVRNYRRTSRASGPQRPKKKESSAEVWKALRPSPSLRDSNVRYQAIGKTKGSGYDDVRVFLTQSSLHLPQRPAKECVELKPVSRSFFSQLSTTTSASCGYESATNTSTFWNPEKRLILFLLQLLLPPQRMTVTKTKVPGNGTNSKWHEVNGTTFSSVKTATRQCEACGASWRF